MDETLVKHAEHDVHGDHRGEQQEEFVTQRGLEGGERSLETEGETGVEAKPRHRAADLRHRRAESGVRSEVEGKERRRKLVEPVDLQIGGAFADGGNRRKRHLPGRRERGGHVELAEIGKRLARLGGERHDHPVLVGLGVDGRNDPLPKRIVERVVDGGRGDAETGGGNAVDVDFDRMPPGLIVIGEITKTGKRGERFLQPGGGLGETPRVGVFEDELVFGRGDRGIDGEILHRLQIEANAGN